MESLVIVIFHSCSRFSGSVNYCKCAFVLNIVLLKNLYTIEIDYTLLSVHKLSE